MASEDHRQARERRLAQRRARAEAWTERLNSALLPFMGPAQVSPVDEQPPAPEDRTHGVEGQWVIRRDANGVPYLQARSADHSGR